MHILIAEDDTVSRSMLVMLLRGRGYTIEEAADGGEAWGMLQAVDAPRLVILDWMMPVMDGLDVCRRLRERRGDD
ncbi:MAG TPA: diguanylate cyclase response regulator, partial [Verrucomicrobia bacterium]|nr:diguanylate cyclase response regulator [Verrucomicrobiota bacterium]